MRPISRSPICALLLAFVAPLLAGCASSMSNMWRDETFQTSGMKTVLVVALRPDPTRRRIWEDNFAAGIVEHGVKATPSYRLFPGAPPDTQQVIEAVKRDGYDGVLTNMRLPDGEEKTFIHGYTRRESITKRSPFTGAYYTVWQDVHVPGRTESTTVANFKTDLWTTGDDPRLVWSGSTRTTNRVDAAFIHNKVEKLILPELTKAGILPPKPKSKS